MARSATALIAFLLLAGAGLLTGCGASLNSEMAGTLGPTDQRAGASAGLGTTASGTDAGSGATPAGTTPASKAADAITSVPSPGNTADKIGAQDVIKVSVFKVPELSKSVQVADTGTINLPLVGEIAAAGKTAQEVERDLTKQLGAKYLQSPQVTVYVKEYNSQRVTIEGAVKKPGVYPVRSKSSLLQFIAMAEGLDPNSDSTVVVFRQIDGKRSAARFDIGEIRSGQAQDPAIQSGDVVVAGTSALKETFNNLMKALPIAGAFALL